MKYKKISTILFFILLFTSPTFGQESNSEKEESTLIVTSQDTTHREKYGLRVGIDISKIARTLFDEDYTGFMIEGDFRVYENYYLAAEIGNEKLPFSEDNITVSASGSFIKIGANYNAYDNWQGMQNIVFAGIRYGFTTFKQDLRQYNIYYAETYFDDDIRAGEEVSGLTAGWIELMGGLKVEVLNNLYLSAHVQLKRRINQTTPNGFDNLTIPGFGRTFDGSTFGVGYGYSISYMIPIFKRAKN